MTQTNLPHRPARIETCHWGRGETPTHWITMGTDPDPDRCLETTLRDMIVLLGEKGGLSRERHADDVVFLFRCHGTAHSACLQHAARHVAAQQRVQPDVGVGGVPAVLAVEAAVGHVQRGRVANCGLGP